MRPSAVSRAGECPSPAPASARRSARCFYGSAGSWASAQRAHGVAGRDLLGRHSIARGSPPAAGPTPWRSASRTCPVGLGLLWKLARSLNDHDGVGEGGLDRDWGLAPWVAPPWGPGWIWR